MRPLQSSKLMPKIRWARVFPLTVEYFGEVPNFGWLKQVIVKLPDAIANSVEIRVSLKVRGTAGNKVIVKVKP